MQKRSTAELCSGRRGTKSNGARSWTAVLDLGGRTVESLLVKGLGSNIAGDIQRKISDPNPFRRPLSLPSVARFFNHHFIAAREHDASRAYAGLACKPVGELVAVPMC